MTCGRYAPDIGSDEDVLFSETIVIAPPGDLKKGELMLLLLPPPPPLLLLLLLPLLLFL